MKKNTASKIVDVADIILSYLKENGYDGLYTTDECACSLDDFMPCGGEDVVKCMPGYKCTPEVSAEYDFYICGEK